jgi:hypothetical protein
MPFARETLANYLTEEIRDVVRAEVLDAVKSRDKLYTQPRIFEDLLSSQPLCFNLFGPLQRDLDLASRVFGELLELADIRVSCIEFEHSPGRGDRRFTDDYSAFDVFVGYEIPAGHSGFVAIEVKYAENLVTRPARHRARYEQVADEMGVFLPDKRAHVRAPPLEQFWRDHLLAGSVVLDGRAGYERGTFVVVFPSKNELVGSAVARYASCRRRPPHPAPAPPRGHEGWRQASSRHRIPLGPTAAPFRSSPASAGRTARVGATPFEEGALVIERDAGRLGQPSGQARRLTAARCRSRLPTWAPTRQSGPAIQAE